MRSEKLRLLLLALTVAAGASQDEQLQQQEVVCVPSLTQTLRNGVEMPRVSFGTAALPRGRGHERVIAAAVRAGFRSFDTAQATEWYDEASVARALNGSGVPREAFFVTTKLHPRDLGYGAAKAAVARSVAHFNFGGGGGGPGSGAGEATGEAAPPVDLVLLHYPRCFQPVCTPEEQRRTEARPGDGPDGESGWRGAWRALNELLVAEAPGNAPKGGGGGGSGAVRAAGVSNFDERELRDLDPL